MNYRDAGRIGEAIPLLEEAYQASKRLPSLSFVGGQLALFSMTLITLKAWDEAEPLLLEALTIREAKEPDEWRTFVTQSMLGGALLGQKKYAESETLLLAGYRGMKQREAAIPALAKIRIFEAIDRLIELYTDWHAAEPDQGYDAKAVEWQTKLDDFKAATTAETPSPNGKAK